jgi:hypothetical protein
MPGDLRELHKLIWSKVEAGQISEGVATYSVGRIFFDLFERAAHDAANGKQITSADLDRYASELPERKIDRDIEDAQQSFGAAAADFMEADTQQRIREAIDSSIVATVRGFTSGWRAFGMNVIAGIVAGVLFAALTLGLWWYAKVDPSPVAIGKQAIEGQAGPSTTTR